MIIRIGKIANPIAPIVEKITVRWMKKGQKTWNIFVKIDSKK